MDRLVKIDKDEFIKQMQGDFLATMNAVAQFGLPAGKTAGKLREN